MEQLWPGVRRWNRYSEIHRCDLATHSVEIGRRVFLFDPMEVLPGMGSGEGEPAVTAVVMTNGNHERAVWAWASRLGVPVYAGTVWEGMPADATVVGSGEAAAMGWEIGVLAGGGPGETVWYAPAHSLAVFGDAVIHLPGRGLELLPSKYCADHGELKRSVGAWMSGRRFERAVFGHGEPILEAASERLRGLAG